MAKILIHCGELKEGSPNTYRKGDILHCLPSDEEAIEMGIQPSLVNGRLSYMDFGLYELYTPSLFLPLIVTGMSWAEAKTYVCSRKETLTTLSEQSHYVCDIDMLNINPHFGPGYKYVGRTIFLKSLSIKDDRNNPLWTGKSRLII